MSIAQLDHLPHGNEKRICAIHQPNFFPWLGYFDKIRRAETFVFLDDVAYPKSGSGMGSWVNRVKIAVHGKAHWIGCPLQRYSGSKTIRDVKIVPGPWRDKLLRTLEMSYRRAPGYADAMAIIEPLVGFCSDSLAEFNINAITALCRRLGIATRFVRQSELGVSGAGTRLLVDIVQAAHANAYLCGNGADGYQDDVLFPAHGIELVYQNFIPQSYGNLPHFIAGLSVIDFLMMAPEARFAPSSAE